VVTKVQHVRLRRFEEKDYNLRVKTTSVMSTKGIDNSPMPGVMAVTVSHVDTRTAPSQHNRPMTLTVSENINDNDELNCE
jgi:hypothetical protein